MYVSPMGMPIREITSVSVALKASVRSPTCAFLGSILFADARMGRTVDEPMKKRMKVATKQSPERRGQFDCQGADRKSTRLNSSHGYISYAVFCLKKKNVRNTNYRSTK